uniref:Bm1658, isoform a n=1 Tax=Brugia malayi TaxID=6279 RepID=A0A1I9G664_BRUMA|nr:Bm1658, isoform a [Brugia malayi]
MLHTIIISMIFISLYANQLDNKSLRRRCDSLNGITCECANPLVSDAQGCKHLEEYYDVSMEPALFLTFQNMEVLNLHLQQHFEIYQSQEIDATTGIFGSKSNSY